MMKQGRVNNHSLSHRRKKWLVLWEERLFLRRVCLSGVSRLVPIVVFILTDPRGETTGRSTADGLVK
jgi:hypothetical protein